MSAPVCESPAFIYRQAVGRLHLAMCARATASRVRCDFPRYDRQVKACGRLRLLFLKLSPVSKP